LCSTWKIRKSMGFLDDNIDCVWLGCGPSSPTLGRLGPEIEFGLTEITESGRDVPFRGEQSESK
jgi:hypothetical protein